MTSRGLTRALALGIAALTVVGCGETFIVGTLAEDAGAADAGVPGLGCDAGGSCGSPLPLNPCRGQACGTPCNPCPDAGCGAGIAVAYFCDLSGVCAQEPVTCARDSGGD